MKIEIDYNPSPEEVRLALRKAHTSAIRTRYAILADHEIRQTRDAIDRQVAAAVAAGSPLELEVGKVFGTYGPDAIEAQGGEDEVQVRSA